MEHKLQTEAHDSRLQPGLGRWEVAVRDHEIVLRDGATLGADGVSTLAVHLSTGGPTVHTQLCHDFRHSETASLTKLASKNGSTLVPRYKR